MKFDFETLEYNKIEERLLSYIKTSYAKEILDNDLKYDFDSINLRLNETKEASLAILKLGDIPISNLANIKPKILRAQSNGILNEIELNEIVLMLNTALNVKKYSHDLQSIKFELKYLSKYIDALDENKALKNSITLAISEDNRVVDNASRELMAIRRSLKSLDNRLKMKLNEIIQLKGNMLTEPLIVQRDNRYCIPVKVEYKNSIKGIIHDMSSSQTTVYIEPDIAIEIENQIESFKNKEKKEIENILKGLTLLVSAEAEILLNDFYNLTCLDIIYAKALFGKENKYNIPELINEPKFNLKNAKHPLIDSNICVPIDIYLEDKNKIIIITGPNTGGKTVVLKTVGLIHLMAYNGLMVPLKEDSKIGYFENILVDIGDEQSIEQSLSTFSSHLTRIIKILDYANKNSLILLDELGSGTDPKEGSSLAIAIIDYLFDKESNVICTTHYNELKKYAYNKNGIMNASVEFNVNTLMPTYRLLLGIPGKSNAIEIAKRLGLKDEIIERSKNEYENSQTESGNLMVNLEEELNKCKALEAKLEKEIADAKDKSYQLSKEKIELIKSKDKIIADAKIEAEKIIEETKQNAENLIKEIENMSDIEFKDHQLIDVKTKANKLKSNFKEEEESNEEFKVNDYVYVKTYEKYGRISKIVKNKYYVTIGSFDIDFAKNELTHAEAPKEKKKKEVRMSGYNPASHAKLSLDLRGKRADEVDSLLDQYLDQCILGNLSQVTIIHGFGTGVVRTKVQEYLKKSPIVKSYRYGGEGEGLNGVTVVYLK